MPIPGFQNHPGLDEPILPVGVHRATVQEVKTSLVDQFPDSATRKQIFTGWLVLRAIISGIVPVLHEYIDGSFVTARPNPGDVDLSVWVEADTLNGLVAPDQDVLSYVFDKKSRTEIKRTFRCDPYLVARCDPGHPAYRRFQHMLWTQGHWAAYKDRAGRVRPEVSKGFIEVAGL